MPWVRWPGATGSSTASEPAHRELIQSHLSRPGELEQALAIAEAQDISRQAVARRYVTLHSECLAVAFTANGRVRYVERGNGLPHLTVWKSDDGPALPPEPRDGSELTTLDEVSAPLWLSRPDGVTLFAQTLYQAAGYATTLLLGERKTGAGDDNDRAPWEPRSAGRYWANFPVPLQISP